MADRMKMIREAFDALIADAEAELTRAELEHALAMARVIDTDDPGDVAHVQEWREQTGAEVYAAKAVADAIENARNAALVDVALCSGAAA